MKTISLYLCVLILAASCSKPADNDSIDLSGEWAFKLDPESQGITDNWFSSELPGKVNLPGSLAENNIGEDVSVNTRWTGTIVDSSWFFSKLTRQYRKPGHVKIPFWLQPDKYYAGMAWYQKKVNIPDSWNKKNIRLFLERCHWETRVWVDDQEAGVGNSLGTPHIFDLTKWLVPGNHTITICVDNRVKDINVGENSHSISDHTQSNWNGIVGKLALQSRPTVFIENVELVPDLTNKLVKAKLDIQNSSGSGGKVTISLAGSSEQRKRFNIEGLTVDQIVSPGMNHVEIKCPMGDSILLWDEFHPDLYRMHIEIADAEGRKDSKELTFGMREFRTRGTQFTINGSPLFLRGTLECAIFPKTGYPPADTASWMRIFRIARAHGLNHMRFHSWCPPEAAFDAADRSGFYLHVECSSWANSNSAIGDGKPVDKFIYEESERMVKEYGNHPSFCIMLYGNEPGGANHEKWLADFVKYWKNKDSRRLYSSGAGWPDLPETDFNSTPNPRIQRWGEGMASIINSQPPKNDYDWTPVIAGYDKPALSHEIGQWCVYPDFKEIRQYTGVLKAKNFEIFQESLRRNNMRHLADSFLRASGRLQVLCYKADIEAALRTPGFGGFQLLDLHDFPGQGTALVGVLNPFWNSKGYVTPTEFREFCSETVPLIRLPKMIYNSDEILKIKAEIAHFGTGEIKDATPSWTITDANGRMLFRGSLPKITIPVGNGISLGEIIQPLNGLKKPEKLIITLEVAGYQNHWDIWVYPVTLPDAGKDILVAQKMDARVLDVLSKGGKVLLIPVKGSVRPDNGGTIAVGFSSIFWNTAWTAKQPPHTLGILCNPDHPALAEFPTEFHSNWQWWDAMSHSNAIMLADLTPGLEPIVRIIDDWFTNRSLALVFEVNTGKGKMVICGADLLTGNVNRPEARQLLYSLKSYMSGNEFNPQTFVDAEKIAGLFNN